MHYFHIISTEEKNHFLNYRKGETHLGEQVASCDDENDGEALFQNPDIKFVLLGLPEDIGVRANCGIGGAHTVWPSFLKSFLNIQETEQLQGKHFFLYGYLQKTLSPIEDSQTDLIELRQQTQSIDDLVYPVIQKIIRAKKIPIVIGGGHNNAFPILKGASLVLNRPINALNTDPHADFRGIEGRHSGNGFSYAFTEGYLKRYFVLGLHEAYNSLDMMENMASSEDIQYVFWEDIFLRKKINWEDAITKGLEHVSGDYFGTELDIDSIENTLSSAMTPVGIYAREAMNILYTCGKSPQSLYLHLPEAIRTRADGLTNPMSGKLLSYLVQAFTKGVLERGKSLL